MIGSSTWLGHCDCPDDQPYRTDKTTSNPARECAPDSLAFDPGIRYRAGSFCLGIDRKTIHTERL
jgi:hypothetical protein